MLNNKDPKGVQAEQSGGYSHGYSLYSKGTTVGFRYALRHNISLNSEYSSYNGTAWMPVFDELDHSSQKKNWHIAAVQLVFDF